MPPGTLSDMWAAYDYLAPGVFLLATKSYPTGAAAASGMAPPSAMPDWVSSTSQAVTPIDDTHTIYYYSSCLSRQFATEEHSQQQMAVIERAFAEDRAMIEAQQQVIGRSSNTRMVRLAADGSLNQFRRLMAQLIEAEQPAASAAE